MSEVMAETEQVSEAQLVERTRIQIHVNQAFVFLQFMRTVVSTLAAGLYFFFFFSQGVLKFRILRFPSLSLFSFGYDPLAFVFLRSTEVGLDQNSNQWTAA